MAVAASRTTNPFLLVLIMLVVALVVVERREPGLTNPLLPFVLVGLVAIVAPRGDGGAARRRRAGTGRAVHAAAGPAAGVDQRGPARRRRSPWKASSRRCTTGCDSPRCWPASAPATRWPALAGCCATSRPRSTTSAPRSSWPSPSPPSSSTTRGGSGRRDGCAATRGEAPGRSAGSPSRCWSGRWSGPWTWRRRWSRGDTVGSCVVPPARPGSPALLTLVGLAGVVVGVYGLLDATSAVVLGLPMLAAGARVHGGGPRRRGHGATAAATTGATGGGSPSGSWSSPGSCPPSRW